MAYTGSTQAEKGGEGGIDKRGGGLPWQPPPRFPGPLGLLGSRHPATSDQDSAGRTYRDLDKQERQQTQEPLNPPSGTGSNAVNVNLLPYFKQPRGAWHQMCEDYGLPVSGVVNAQDLRAVLGCTCAEVALGWQDEALRVGKKMAGVLAALNYTSDGSVSVTFADPTGRVQGYLHPDVIDEYGPDLCVGSVVVLSGAAILVSGPGVQRWLNVVPENVRGFYKAVGIEKNEMKKKKGGERVEIGGMMAVDGEEPGRPSGVRYGEEEEGLVAMGVEDIERGGGAVVDESVRPQPVSAHTPNPPASSWHGGGRAGEVHSGMRLSMGWATEDARMQALAVLGPGVDGVGGEEGGEEGMEEGAEDVWEGEEKGMDLQEGTSWAREGAGEGLGGGPEGMPRREARFQHPEKFFSMDHDCGRPLRGRAGAPSAGRGQEPVEKIGSDAASPSAYFLGLMGGRRRGEGKGEGGISRSEGPSSLDSTVAQPGDDVVERRKEKEGMGGRKSAEEEACEALLQEWVGRRKAGVEGEEGMEFEQGGRREGWSLSRGGVGEGERGSGAGGAGREAIESGIEPPPPPLSVGPCVIEGGKDREREMLVGVGGGEGGEGGREEVDVLDEALEEDEALWA